MSQRVGFVGLGRMGQHMALNLVEAGHDVVVWNRTAQRCAPLVERGATVAASPAEVAELTDTVITCLSDGAAAEAVYEGPDGLLAGSSKGDVLVDMSTVGPDLTRSLHARAAAQGAAFLDAPVSGSIPAARDRSLIAMVGGDAATFEAVRPVLAAMTREQFFLGPPGAGSAMKLAINTIAAVGNLAISEGLVLAERNGISREDAYGVFTESVIASPFVHYKREAFLDPDQAEVWFTIRLLKKDLGLAIELGRQSDVPMLAAAVANEALTLAVGHGYGEGDVVRMADTLREMAEHGGGTKPSSSGGVAVTA